MNRNLYLFIAFLGFASCVIAHDKSICAQQTYQTLLELNKPHEDNGWSFNESNKLFKYFLNDLSSDKASIYYEAFKSFDILKRANASSDSERKICSDDDCYDRYVAIKFFVGIIGNLDIKLRVAKTYNPKKRLEHLKSEEFEHNQHIFLSNVRTALESSSCLNRTLTPKLFEQLDQAIWTRKSDVQKGLYFLKKYNLMPFIALAAGTYCGIILQ